MVTKYDVKNRKPDPKPYLLALDKLSAKPEEAVVIEDSESGIISGKKAGCFVIGVKAGNPNQDFSKADVVLDNLSKIKIY